MQYLRSSSRVIKLCYALLSLSGVVYLAASSPQQRGAKLGAAAPATVSATAARQPLRPLRFEANQGQFNSTVKFLGRGAGVQVFLTAREAVLNLPAAGVRMRLAGAHDAPHIAGRAPLPGVSNYFIGQDPARWRTGVPTFQQVHYADVYDGIDLLYYGNAGQLEYDFVVAPHADPQQIAFDFAEATPLLDAAGELVIQLGQSEVRWRKPVAYQSINGERRAIAAAFTLRNPPATSHQQVAFELGDYDHALPLVIDPVLSYATYLGGGNLDTGAGMVIDNAGNIYVTGKTNSVDFPVGSAAGNPFQSLLGGAPQSLDNPGLTDVYVTKFSPGGGSLIYSTYLGGTGADEGTALAVDASGNVFVTGIARLFNFPIVNAIQPDKHTSGDSFVAKLNATGSALIFSTYFGGNTPAGLSSTDARAIAVDANGNAYVVGKTNVFDLLVTPGAFQSGRMGINDGSNDGFVAKFNPVGGIVYSTYFGGGGDDQINDIAVDGAGNAYLTGLTRSGNFPTQSPIQPGLNGNSLSDGFVTKLNAAGSQLIYSTYLGGNGNDQGNGIAVDNTGSVYVTGLTRSPLTFPVVNAFQSTYGGDVTNFSVPSDVFVTRLNPAGTAYVYSTYLGGNFTDTGYDIAVDNAGNAYVTGITLSSNIPFPTKNAFQPNYNSIGFADAFVARFNTNLSGANSLIYSSYLGGNNTDSGNAIARDNAGRAYVFGETSSSNFPTVNPLPGQNTMRGFSDAFLAIVSDVALTPNVQAIAVGGSGSFTVTINPAQAAAITIPLNSSNPAIASVPASVTINANATSALFNVTGVAGGTATITATLPASLGGGTLTATVQVVPLEIALVSGQQQTGSLIAPDPPGSGVLGLTQYTIAVPPGATQLKVDLSGNTDVDLYVRFGQRVAIQNGNAVADFRSESAAGIESVTITPGSTPALQAGTYYIAVANFGPGASTFVVTATVTGGTCPTITVNPATLPNGRAGTAYNQPLTAAGGTGSYTFALSAGALPAGLTLSSAGLLTGTSTVFGAFNFTVTATDTSGCTGSRGYTLTINPPCSTLVVNPATLANGFVGTAYSQTLSATGGAAPYSFAVTAGALPNGLTLNATSGALSGTPVSQNTFSFTITATDANGCTGARAYTVSISGTGLQFYPLAAPVRLLDTRLGASPNACSQPNAPIAGGTARTQSARNFCSIPANAAAITGNITTVQSGGGFLTLYPSDATQPTVANTNYGANEVINNVFTVGLGSSDGAFKIFALTTTAVVVDVTGYYAPPSASGLYFHPLPTPVRLLETRAGMPVGCVRPGAPLAGGQESLQTATTACTGIPATARAIVGNATTVGPQGGGFLTIFPADAARPLIASSNYNLGQIVNGPFTTGLSATGQFKVFTVATTDLVIDLLGYYSTEAVDANGAGLLLTPLPRPVRLLETRAGQTVGCFKPGAPLNGGQSYTQTARGVCDGLTVPASALGVVGNATVVTPLSGGFLTLWPSSAAQPTVATSNYNAGQVFNRHFIVGLGNGDGAFKLFSSATTELVIDVAGYFAP